MFSRFFAPTPKIPVEVSTTSPGPDQTQGITVGNLALTGSSPASSKGSSYFSARGEHGENTRTSPTSPDRSQRGGLGGSQRGSPRKVSFGGTASRRRGGTESSSASGSSREPSPTYGPSSEKRPPVPHDSRSTRAADALGRLQAPHAYKEMSTEWTAYDAEIIADNIGVLQRAVDKTLPSMAGQKRTHSQAGNSDDSESEDKPLKRLKGKNKRFIKPQDLAKLAPQPIRIDYKTHPLEDRSDQWYITMFNKLFTMCDKFVTEYFGIHDLESEESVEPWEANLSLEFISWAEQVAEEDPNVNGWDGIMRETAQRKWLVMAILMKILKIKVFDDDLWGANTQQSDLLLGIERTFLNREGFQRTELRSETVRKILGLAPVTENFYSEIALLTAQVALLFKPLSDYLYCIPLSSEQELPNFEDQYQALHNVISTAAYLSICIRLSPTIFHFTEISLGELYNPDDQWNLEMDNYTRSKQAVVDSFNSTWMAWSEKNTEADELLSKLEEDDKNFWTRTALSRAYERAYEASLDIKAAEPPQPGLVYRPMAKMSVWPVITRYKAGGEEDDEDERVGLKLALHEKDGFRIYQISKAAIVCYFGEKDRSGRLSLSEFVERKRRRLGLGLLGLGGSMAMAAMLGVGWMAARGMGIADL